MSVALLRHRLTYRSSANSISSGQKRPGIFVSNVGVAWWNPLTLIVYPQSTAIHPQFMIFNPPFSILLPQISFNQPQFSIFNSSISIHIQKYGIFDYKCPKNSVISDKMSASATCTAACSFFQVCTCLSVTDN